MGDELIEIGGWRALFVTFRQISRVVNTLDTITDEITIIRVSLMFVVAV
jgi:hypothetical protein